MANIDDFKARLKGGGVRLNQFKVTIPFPGFASVGGETTEMAFLCHSSKSPQHEVGDVTVDFRGRTLHLAGDRKFETWSTTVYNDTDYKVYRAIERWMNGMNNITDNEGLTNPSDYQVDAFVDSLDRNGALLKSWTFRGMFPTVLPGFNFSYAEATKVAEFDVTWQYQYFETDTTT
jgi:hypothetical protein